MGRGTRLIVNADDLGLHPSLDAGILRAHREGIVTSATLLVMGPGAREAVAQARAQGLALGVHLALSTWLPCAAAPDEVPTVAPGGRLRASWAGFARAWLTGQVRRVEVERELEAQLARAREPPSAPRPRQPRRAAVWTGPSGRRAPGPAPGPGRQPRAHEGPSRAPWRW